MTIAYNDGAKIEEEKFLLINKELLEEFSATTTDTIIASGSWV